MAALTDSQLEQLRGILDEREHFLNEDLRREVGNREEYEQLAGEVPDTVDQATAALVQDINHAEVERDVDALRAIAATREHMQQGTYGLCDKCGKDIPFERLLVQPTATRCVDCQALYEKTYALESAGDTL
ncbi:MAG: TraR/DksA family transcriptional regulator [Rhodocyclales bacterium]|nr:TraR/DksA family transcriptional regulator [Rhodocyclales bacterium]